MSAIEPTAYRKRFLVGVGYQLGLPQSSVGAAKQAFRVDVDTL